MEDYVMMAVMDPGTLVARVQAEDWYRLLPSPEQAEFWFLLLYETGSSFSEDEANVLAGFLEHLLPSEVTDMIAADFRALAHRSGL